MRSLEKGKDKIQAICDKLRVQTLEPAEQEAQKLLEEAKKKCAEIIAEGERHAESLIQQARAEIEQQRTVFHSALQQASKQALESLKQDVEQKFFNEELHHVLAKEMSNPAVIAKLINGIAHALEKDGLGVDFTVVIPQHVSKEEVNALLLDGVRKRFKGNQIEIGNFDGGAQVKLSGKKMTIDLTDQALKELLANYIRKDFRKMVFAS